MKRDLENDGFTTASVAMRLGHDDDGSNGSHVPVVAFLLGLVEEGPGSEATPRWTNNFNASNQTEIARDHP
jgi:hypothetical protein